MTLARPELQLIPAVDVLGKEAVRLVRGAYDDVSFRDPDPYALVKRVVTAGAELVHVVDLTAARSGHVRPELFRRAVAAAGDAGIQAAGGIRSVEDADELVRTGVARIVVGTAAFTDDGLLERLIDRFGDRTVVAVDVRDGVVAIRGWEEATTFTVERAIDRCRAAGVERLLCTAIDRDGTLAGPALDLLDEVVRTSGLAVVAAGGVGSLEDVGAIAAVGCEGAIVGRALLEGRIPMSALAAR
ncbi:MAG TPA: 1-(5-phosphoribosyl)-5-[(5-phosphoribosylamino)methylideneamino] imidazole-4-carboxamide isomerase [Gaiellaceae bacterium]|nr:1-(5-phosphoribosyl)-5-[(5-phosphoribosylamino)methylideneamino] imidazole-4-carboxamide isomerase [Gaiellaceae bacterium]